MIWNDGKIRLDSVLKTAFFGTKGPIWADVINPWRELRAPYGEDFEVENGGLRLAPVFGMFILKN